MTWLTLDDIKRHLNIDDFFTDEDMYLEALGESAEQIVEQQINRPLSELQPIPEALKAAMKLLVEHLYTNRGSDTNDLPPAFYYICKLYRHYD